MSPPDAADHIEVDAEAQREEAGEVAGEGHPELSQEDKDNIENKLRNDFREEVREAVLLDLRNELQADVGIALYKEIHDRTFIEVDETLREVPRPNYPFHLFGVLQSKTVLFILVGHLIVSGVEFMLLHYEYFSKKDRKAVSNTLIDEAFGIDTVIYITITSAFFVISMVMHCVNGSLAAERAELRRMVRIYYPWNLWRGSCVCMVLVCLPELVVTNLLWNLTRQQLPY